MTVGELLQELQNKNPNKEVWVSIPTHKTINIIKDASSVHTDAIEGAVVIECERLNKVQGEFVS